MQARRSFLSAIVAIVFLPVTAMAGHRRPVRRPARRQVRRGLFRRRIVAVDRPVENETDAIVLIAFDRDGKVKQQIRVERGDAVPPGFFDVMRDFNPRWNYAPSFETVIGTDKTAKLSFRSQSRPS